MEPYLGRKKFTKLEGLFSKKGRAKLIDTISTTHVEESRATRSYSQILSVDYLTICEFLASNASSASDHALRHTKPTMAEYFESIITSCLSLGGCLELNVAVSAC